MWKYSHYCFYFKSWSLGARYFIGYFNRLDFIFIQVVINHVLWDCCQYQFYLGNCKPRYLYETIADISFSFKP